MALANPRRCGHSYDDGTTNHGMNRSGGVVVFEVENRSPPLGYAYRSSHEKPSMPQRIQLVCGVSSAQQLNSLS
ncbi:hypothetical protein Enr13x_18950 [Stieleria neptunia]|uniref:Uncharacterized protein n=1 Tax=Stieleria neptunia TaxID=2527979 RepID=A0A518HMG8_9BACT|nr:hypothetical protein Enr13x_18950 [Stieleria neptunia]